MSHIKNRIQFIGFGRCYDLMDEFTNWLKEFNYEFEIVSNNPNIVFISVFGYSNHKQLSEKYKTVYYTGESGRMGGRGQCLTRVNPYADLNLTFENSPQYNNIRYPLWLIYAKTYNSENRKKLANMTLTKKPIHGFCSFVYSNSVKHRNDFCKQLSSYKKVDAGGNCLNNVGKKIKDKLEFQTKYKFCIAYENCLQDGYTTEKIFDAYRSNSIPIYYGSSTINDDFNPQTFINAHDFNSIDSLIEYIKKVDNDDDLYNSFMNKPIFSEKWLNIFKDPQATFFKNIFEKIMN